MRKRSFLPVLLCLCLSLAHAQNKRPITDRDLFRFQWIGDPQVSPDSSRVLFAKVVVNAKRDGYETSLWTVPATGGAMQRLTNGKTDATPRWSPDGKWIAFTRAPEKDGKPQPNQIHLLSLAGGEPIQLTNLPKAASSPVWSPDGKQIAFLSTTSPEDIDKLTRKDRKNCAEEEAAGQEGKTPADPSKKPCPEEHESDVRVITRPVYRFNGPGYLDPKRPTHIWVIDLPTTSDDKPKPRQLTKGKYEEGNIFWSKDGSKIYYTTILLEEPQYELPRADLYAVPAKGGEPQKILASKIDISSPVLSPDGKRIAFRSSANEPVRSYSQNDLYVLELEGNAQPRNLTADFDWDIGSGIGGDQAPPRAAGSHKPIWSRDGSSLVEVVAKEGRANLWRFPLNGKPSEITRGDHAVVRFTSADGGENIITLISSPVMVGDLFAVKGTQQTRITDINQKLWSELSITQPEEIWYTSFDDKKIHTWAQKPPDFDPAKKYPLILNIHGGPHSAWGYTFMHEFQWMAARGYVVVYPNPRGSSTYGQEFGNSIQHKYPGDDHKDLLAAVDEVVKRGYIDTGKLAVTGGSGGGVLTNWIVTRDHRFKAAVSQRDISDWTAFWYTADFTLFHPSWFKAPPFEDPEDYRNRSSITFVKEIRTPIMFVLGEADWRTPPGAGGESLFRALKYLRRPTAMVRFPGESHELSRSGQPWHRIERLQAIIGWFDKFVLGKDVPMFADVMQQGAAVPAQTERRGETQP